MWNYDNSLFESLNFDGIDHETLVNSILLSGGEFEVLYSNLEFMKSAISFWAKKNAWTIKKWVKALELEYNPIENYDRQEEWTDARTGQGITNSTSTSDGGHTLNTHSESTDETGKSAFDSSEYSPYEKNHDSTTSEDKNLYNENTVNNNAYENSDDTSHIGRVHGNIGVTTSQQMLEAELKLARFNLYQQIADLFINEFCIMIY